MTPCAVRESVDLKLDVAAAFLVHFTDSALLHGENSG